MSELYRITSVKGKGLGIIASKFIRKGTDILTEEAQIPYVDYPPNIQAIRAETWIEWIKNITSSFNKMKKSDQKDYLELYNMYEKEEDLFTDYLKKFIKRIEADKEKAKNMYKIVNIYYSNCLGYGLKIKTSRFNHSCRPNTFHDDKTNTIIAISNIESGQEITFNYTSPKVRSALYPMSVRLFGMLNKNARGFTLTCFPYVLPSKCLCDLCLEDKDSLTAKDLKIGELIVEMENMIDSCQDEKITDTSPYFDCRRLSPYAHSLGMLYKQGRTY